MTIMLVGGGSAGHLSPLLAVAEEIKKRRADVRIVAVTQKGEPLAHLLEDHPAIDKVAFVSAGKFRRYFGEKKIQQLTDVKRLALNTRDAARTAKGIISSRKLLKQEKPAVIFIKGGFVGVPIGVAAGQLGVPYITHDSDIIPGLANRIIGSKATLHAVGQSTDQYPYPPDKTVQVGVPFSSSFEPVTQALKAEYRQKLDVPVDAEVITVVGGSLGAQRLDAAVAACAKELLENHPNLYILHIVGKLNEEFQTGLYKDLDENLLKRVRTVTFVEDLYHYSGAADVVVTRAGANSIAEFGTQGTACIIVPNPMLTGGHQTKNAIALADNKAAVIVGESDLSNLGKEIDRVLSDPPLRETLALNLQAATITDAASRLADLILNQADKR